MSALRFNEEKPNWGLVDFTSLVPMVRVLEFGAQKYAPNNWKKGLPTVEVCESLLRHVFAYLEGEDNDPESGLPHVGHILCNAMFLSHMSKRPEMDTRDKEKYGKESTTNGTDTGDESRDKFSHVSTTSCSKQD